MAKRWNRSTRRLVVVLAAAAAVAAAGLAPAAASGAWYEPVDPQSPDSQVGVTGPPLSGTAPDGTVRGYVDAHTHLMSNVGFGGDIVCGATFSPNGIADALKDCDNHYPNG